MWGCLANQEPSPQDVMRLGARGAREAPLGAGNFVPTCAHRLCQPQHGREGLANLGFGWGSPCQGSLESLVTMAPGGLQALGGSPGEGC